MSITLLITSLIPTYKNKLMGEFLSTTTSLTPPESSALYDEDTTKDEILKTSS